ncbi:MAG: Na(+)/H(+) antiporter subunit D [Deltaproteobacteria bacterium]|nr:Na(+)/H(+) antiporter subunit D [Deltaproteobacteria bacterium]MBW2265342.1 Na(+)/H(+) antiporter subunit D [Deltaproteobacteria bacterium]MBW2317737.1 Na(+)/H(+) antiporter subunit D [Deltaproteobacteria bacterium]MBW2600349.1 Na(+)/H(+) antiporter subunit D [Deltaproteobacteria bacterium]
MTNLIPPAAIFIVGALFIPLIKGKLKRAYMLFLPVFAFITLVKMPEGKYWIVNVLDYGLVFGRIDKLSMIFGYIFTIISFIGVLFALKVKDDLQHVSAFMYAGGALGVTFAGDFISLYIFWEIMAIFSTFLILARKTKASEGAAVRYILVHLFGGLCFLAGIVLYIQNTGTIQFEYIGLNGLASWLIFIGIGLNAAIPPLHPWLQDAYPEATVTGAVFLSALTTKSAVYLMARTFAGTELLIYIGAGMTAIPIFYAVLENDVRRVLAYSLINQVGFMMCGIGIGTQLAINGTVSHAFCHILYKALLFMSVGSVLHMTGKIRCTDLGGLYKTMPLTCLFCMIGAASISAFPLFSGFVSKSMIVSASSHEKLIVVWLILQFASAGVFHHAGIKVPFFTFFGHDSGIRTKEPPLNMLLAMGIAAFFCIGIAICPGPLYDILPYPVHYAPYTGAHVVGQLQLLMFGALAFTLLILSGYYPAEMRAINLDTDLFYRKAARFFYYIMDKALNGLNSFSNRNIAEVLPAFVGGLSKNPITSLVTYFMRTAGKDNLAIEDFKRETRPEGTNLIPMGVPVLISMAILFLLFLVFALKI